MAFRPQIGPMSVITNGDMSGNLTSLVTQIPKLSMISYAYSWTGSSPSGSIAVQVSNDYAVDAQSKTVVNAGTWTAIYFSAGSSVVNTVTVSGNTGTGFIDITQTGAFAYRTVYTSVSGTGTLQCVINGKVS